MTPKPDEPTRTETTLTTRIRINIPGSRPIPPVIMRTPVGDEAGPGEGAAGAPGAPGAVTGAPGAPGAPRAGGPAGPAGAGKPALPRRSEATASVRAQQAEQQNERPAEKEKTSDWFAPRKSSTPTPPPARGGLHGGAAPFPGGGASGEAPAGFAGAPASGGVPGPVGTPAPGPQDPSVTAATPFPTDPLGATGANPVLQSPPPVAAPVDDWPMDTSAPSAAGATPWQSGGQPAPAAPVDDWPGGASTSADGATPWQANGQAVPAAPAAPVDDWPGASPSTTAATPWQGDTTTGQAARRSGADDWPGGASTTGATQQPPAPGFADPMATAAMPQVQVPGAQAPVDDWPGVSPSVTGTMPQPPVPGAQAPVDDWPGVSSSTTGAMQQPQAPVDDWPGASPSVTGTMQQPQAPVDDWPGASPATATGATPWNGGGAMGAPGAGGAQGVESTQQFPAPSMGQPSMGQGSAAPFAPATPPGGAAFAGGGTDTPREGVPRIPPPPVGAQQAAPQAPAAPKKKQKQQGGKKGGGPSVPAPAGRAAAGETLVSGVPVVPPPGGQAAKGPVDSGAPRVAVPKPKVPGPGAASGVPAPGGKSAVPPPPGAGKGVVPPPPGAGKGAVPPPPGKGVVPPPPAKSAPAKGAPAKKAKKKGRSKLVLAGGGIVGLVAVAYGAGLLLDHADVPNGTTVLGVSIGGSSKEQAVQKLDRALGDRATAPLKVSVGGKQAELKPEVAGLSIDTQDTVRSASGRDYNPMTVIGSLVGGKRTVEPTIGTDEEKIADALKRVSGETGAAKDGTIKFEPGKAVPVYGQPYQGLDTDKAVDMIAKAYRDRAATGKDTVVELPSSNQEPKVDKAEVDRMMESFAKPAMSGNVIVQTDAAHSIPLGPNSLPKILSVKEVSGKLVDTYNLEEIKQLVLPTFAGVKVQRGDGSKTDVMPQDVVVALRKALVGKTPAERVGVITLNGS
ncbi:hypothetical protein CTZ27_15870 [Streptomyces griseocarneus]|nr:hypothetical protein CTZ27_15870 [Streptomyces griseocarneus]